MAIYTFENALSALQPGVSPLTAVDRLSTSEFQTSTVFGNEHTTYEVDSAAALVDAQGGLQFDAAGLIAPNDYSVEMVVELTGNSGWRRLIDSSDRQSDDGVYIDPANNLDSFSNGGSGSPFTADVATHSLGFFLDNVAGGGQGEWSSGNVALIKGFDIALNADRVAAETADPFQESLPAPEPGTFIFIFTLAAAAGMVVRMRRS